MRRGAPRNRRVPASTRGAKDSSPAPVLSTLDQPEHEAVAALVRAIRRAYGDPPDQFGGIEAFHVHNIHDFARRLFEQGVRGYGAAGRVSKKKRRKQREARQAAWDRTAGKLAGVRRRLERPPVPTDMSQWSDAQRLNHALEVYRRAHDAAAAHAEGAPQLYGQTFELYRELYQRSPDSETGDKCLRALRMVAWELWQLERERFPIRIALDFAGEMVRRHPRSAEAWSEYAALLIGAGEWDKASQCALLAVGLDPALGQTSDRLPSGESNRGKHPLLVRGSAEPELHGVDPDVAGRSGGAGGASNPRPVPGLRVQTRRNSSPAVVPRSSGYNGVFEDCAWHGTASRKRSSGR